MHDTVIRFVNEQLRKMPRRHHVVEFGSRDVNGSIKPQFSNVESYIGVDILEGLGVDVIENAAWYKPLPNQKIDTVACISMLEHTSEAAAIVQNAYDILDDRHGVFICTTVTDPCPKHSSYDGGPLRQDEFYANIDPYQFLEWMKPFQIVTLQYDKFLSGDLFAVGRKICRQ